MRDRCFSNYYAESPYVVVVGATGINDMVSEFSNYGPCIDIFAPGELIWSLSAGEHDAYTSKGACD